MKIILAAIEPGLAEAWEKYFKDAPYEVEICLGSILDVPADAIVSPGNSFGFMDGGIDQVYTEYFGSQLQHRLRREILCTGNNGELLVGQAIILPVHDLRTTRFKYLIAAPTMRVPMVLKDSVNPYLATRAALWRGLNGHREINSIAFPGMGTGVGRVPFDVCAHQMKAAFDYVTGPFQGLPSTWLDASKEHQLLYRDDYQSLTKGPWSERFLSKIKEAS